MKSDNRHLPNKISWITAASLFIVALLPRVFGLSIFITSDEPLWLTRSIAFAEALASGNWAGTFQTGHPGVTTMWTGSMGIAAHYLYERSPLTFAEFLQLLSHNPEQIDLNLLSWVRMPTVILAAVCVVLLYRWSRPLIGNTTAIIGALLLAFDPLFLAHSRTLHHDALATIFIALSVLMLLNHANTVQSKRSYYLVISAILAGFALLSKGTSLALTGFAGILFGWLWLFKHWSLRRIVTDGAGWLAIATGVFFAAWPAMWAIPGQALSEVFGWVLTSADVADIAATTSIEWEGRIPDLGVLFYPVNWLLKSTMLSLLGLAGIIGWWRHSPHRPTTSRPR